MGSNPTDAIDYLGKMAKDSEKPVTEEKDWSLFITPPLAIPVEQWAKYAERLRSGSSEGDEREGDE